MTKIEIFLTDLQMKLNSRLNPEYNKVWVQGNSKNGCVSFVLTLFSKYSYKMEFVNDKNVTLNIESDQYLKYVDNLIIKYNKYFRSE